MFILKEFKVKTNSRVDFTDITDKIVKVVSETKVKEGTVNVFVPHTTAALTINENADPDVIEDIKGIVERLVPRQGAYKHREGNTAAHMMTSLMGSTQTMIIHQGRLMLGIWQGVYLAEFDGPRERRILLQVQGEV